MAAKWVLVTVVVILILAGGVVGYLYGFTAATERTITEIRTSTVTSGSTTVTTSAHPYTIYMRPIDDCYGHKPPTYFLIIANNSGFNNSVIHLRQLNFSKPYPVIQVTQGSQVTILFCNLSQHEAFSLAIEHYFPDGWVLYPNQASAISFATDKPGEFRFYNDIFNTIDLYVRNGLLIVKAS